MTLDGRDATRVAPFVEDVSVVLQIVGIVVVVALISFLVMRMKQNKAAKTG